MVTNPVSRHLNSRDCPRRFWVLKVVAVTSEGAATTHGASNWWMPLQVLGAGDSGFPRTSTAPTAQALSPVEGWGLVVVGKTSLVEQCPCWSCRDDFRVSGVKKCVRSPSTARPTP